MSEELLQRGLDKDNPTSKMGKWNYYDLGATTIKALKNAHIIRNVNYGKLETKRVDALITQKTNVIAVIEFKQPKEFKTKAQKNKAIKQEIEVAKVLGSKIIIATDTVDTVWVNALTGKEILNEDGNAIREHFEPTEKVEKLIEKINYSINEKNNKILPKKLVNPTDLARSIWQDVWSVSGATPENCLYTFVELFIFKYLSDLSILKNRYSFDFLMSLQETDTNDEILQYYADEIRKKIKELFPYNPIDNTTIINGTIFVSKDQKAVAGYSTVFMKVLKKFQKYGKLEHIDYDFKSQLFESFLKESISKKNWGQFFTPIKVIRAIEKMAKDEIKEGISICDPACGVGKFLLEPIKSQIEKFYEVDGEKVKQKIILHGFDKGFDKDEQKTIILAKANMLIYFSELIKDYPEHTVEFGKIFNETFVLKTNSILGTLSEPVLNEYDLILTNPPYVTSGSSNSKEEIKKDLELKSYYKVNAIGIEGLFMEWIIRALKPNGKAFIVVPDGIFNRQNDKNLREFVKEQCYIDAIISLPKNTFFSTNKKTYILAITKKNSIKDKQIEPIFTYLVSEIGESRDVNRFPIEQNDLDEAVELFNFFKGNKKGFEKINTDKRCKIFNINDFEADKHWSVDRWWSKEEQISIGIYEEDIVMNTLEFSTYVADISDNLSELSNILKEESQKKNFITNKKKISLSNETYFHLFIGKRITKTSLQNISGNIPIYSANVFKPMGYHNSSNIEKFNTDSIIWGIDGNFEFNLIEKNQIFRTTDHCGTIKVLKKDILPAYVIVELNRIKSQYGFDRELRASLKNMKNIEINIPILENGDFDIELQEEIVRQYNIIQDIHKTVSDYQNAIESLTVDIDVEYENFQEFALSEIFDLSITTNKSFFTKSFIEKNKGNIPVFSASNNENSVNYGFVQDNLPKVKYFNDCLTWNIDGSMGKVFFRKGRFSLSEKVIPLVIREEIASLFDMIYLKFTIEVLAKKLDFSFTNKAGKTKIGKIKIKIPIKNNKIDIDKQREIAEKYKRVENLKSLVKKELLKFDELEINFI